jgi:hypothetical protein
MHMLRGSSTFSRERKLTVDVVIPALHQSLKPPALVQVCTELEPRTYVLKILQQRPGFKLTEYDHPLRQYEQPFLHSRPLQSNINRSSNGALPKVQSEHHVAFP